MFLFCVTNIMFSYIKLTLLANVFEVRCDLTGTCEYLSRVDLVGRWRGKSIFLGSWPLAHPLGPFISNGRFNFFLFTEANYSLYALIQRFGLVLLEVLKSIDASTAQQEATSIKWPAV